MDDDRVTVVLDNQAFMPCPYHTHAGSIEDGIFLSGSNGERLPACCSGESLA